LPPRVHLLAASRSLPRPSSERLSSGAAITRARNAGQARRRRVNVEESRHDLPRYGRPPAGELPFAVRPAGR